MIAADSSTFYIKQTTIIFRSLCVYRTSTVTRTVITDFCIYFAEIAPPNPPKTLPYSSGAVAMAVFSLMVPDEISALE